MFLKFFGKSPVASKFKGIVAQVNGLEAEIQALSDADLLAASQKLKTDLSVFPINERIAKLDEVLPRAFALVRESARRTLKQRHFDVQLMGG